jgi:hypothetical protein
VARQTRFVCLRELLELLDREANESQRNRRHLRETGD